jgi:hypothetical protein
MCGRPSGIVPEQRREGLPRTSSIGRLHMSSQGESRSSGSGNAGPSKRSSAHNIWVQVVPHFFGVLTTMSPGRNSNPSQRALSSTNDL